MSWCSAPVRPASQPRSPRMMVRPVFWQGHGVSAHLDALPSAHPGYAKALDRNLIRSKEIQMTVDSCGPAHRIPGIRRRRRFGIRRADSQPLGGRSLNSRIRCIGSVGDGSNPWWR